MDGFCAERWCEIGDLFAAILDHPFNRELASGTLARERFAGYVIQDAHYLDFFARALAAAAARAPTSAGQVELARASAEAITVERTLHEQFFRLYGIDERQWRATPPSPTCFAYGHYLLATALSAPYGVALAALVPCFRIYEEVGKALLARARTGEHPYRAWIDTYADEAFAATVRRIEDLCDEAAAQAGREERQAMRQAYLTSSRLEWMFWDAAWRMEAWPVPLPGTPG